MSILKSTAFLGIFQKSISLVLSVMFLFSAAMTGTLAWKDFSQHKSNVFAGASNPLYVKLTKYAIDLEGKKTKELVSDAEFYLYSVSKVEGEDDTLIGGPYTTNSKGQISLEYLPLSYGDYYFLETNAPYGFELEENVKYAFKVSDLGAEVVAYNRRLYNDLRLTKTVENETGDPLTEEQIEEEFEFTVIIEKDTFTEDAKEPTYKYTIDDGEEKEIKSGETIKLKSGQTAKVVNIPVGAEYKITETPVNNYTIESYKSVGAITTDGADVSFKNIYNRQAPDEGRLKISKKVLGEGANLSKKFAFTVQFTVQGEYKYTINGKEFSVKSGEKIHLANNEVAVFVEIPAGIGYIVTEDNYESEYYFAGTTQMKGTTLEDTITLNFQNFFKDPNRPTSTTGDPKNTSSPSDPSDPSSPYDPSDPSAPSGATQPPETTSTIPIDEEYGALKLTKLVSGEDADLNKKFEFKIEFDNDYTYPFVCGSQSGTLKSGDSVFMKHNEVLIIMNIPVGTKYIVTETSYKSDGYVAGIEEFDGIIIPEVAVEQTAINEKELAESKLIVTKQLFGEDADFDKEFSFIIEFSDNGTYEYVIGNKEFTVKSGDKITLKNAQSAEFKNLPNNLEFVITEVDYREEGYYPAISSYEGTIVEIGTIVNFVNVYYAPITEPTDPSGGTTLPSGVTDPSGGTTLPSGVTDPSGGTTLPSGVTDPSGGTTSPSGITDPTGTTEPPIKNKGDLEISKTVNGIIEKDKAFEFTVRFFDIKGNETFETFKYKIGNKEYQIYSGQKFTLKHGESILITDIPVGTSFTVEEGDYSNAGYISSITKVSGFIVGKGYSKAEFVNVKDPTPGKAKLVVRKFYDSEVSDSLIAKEFEFTIKIGDKEPEKFLLKNGQVKEFTLDIGTYYEITEADYSEEGFLLTTSANASGTIDSNLIAADFINTFVGTVMVDITGEKTWDLSAYSGNKDNYKLPSSVTITLKNGDAIVETKIVQKGEGDKYKYTFTAPKYDLDGKIIRYTIEEDALDNFIAEYSGKNIKNHYAESVTYIPSVKKTITKDVPKEDATFNFELIALEDAPMPENSEDGIKTVSITGEGTTDFGEIKFSKAGEYSYTISEVQNNAQGYTYDKSVYTLTVNVIAQNKKFVVKSATITKDTQQVDIAEFVNVYSEKDTNYASVKVSKVWEDYYKKHADSVTVQLLKDSKAYGDPVTLSESNSWTYTWRELEKDAIWTVEEINIPEGYRPVYSGTLESGFVITNVDDTGGDDEKVIIEGQKTWEHKTNPEDKHPEQIIVLVKNGSYVAKQKIITESDGWKWSFELPKYNSQGIEIEYTVDEVNIPYYKKTINGYSIINTYTGDASTTDPTDPNGGGNNGGGGGGSSTNGGNNGGGGSNYPGGNPETGDQANIVFWFVVMIISALSLRYVLLYKRKPKKASARRKR